MAISLKDSFNLLDMTLNLGSAESLCSWRNASSASWVCWPAYGQGQSPVSFEASWVREQRQSSSSSFSQCSQRLATGLRKAEDGMLCNFSPPPSPSFKSESLLRKVNPLAHQGRYGEEKGITTLAIESSYLVFAEKHGFRKKFL